MEEMKCETCRWWMETSAHKEDGKRLGVCKRHAPITEPVNNDTLWPCLWNTEACGDWEEK